jgi:hypothetical protein
VSEYHGDSPSGGSPSGGGGQTPSSGRPDNGGQSGTAGSPRSGSQPRTNGQSSRASQSARPSDPVADFQRWLMKAGARSMANQVADQVKRTLGQDRKPSADVWDTATNEPPPNEPPECQWCPVCQAARRARESGPGSIGARLADAGGILGSLVQDAFSAFEQAIKVQDQTHSSERTVVPPPPPPSPSRGDSER